MDLLLHKVVIATLHDVVHLHLQGLQHPGHCQGAVWVAHIEDAVSTFAQMDDVIVLQHHHPRGQPEQESHLGLHTNLSQGE